MTTFAVASIAVLGLSACGSGSGTAADPESVEATSPPPATQEPTGSPSPEDTAEASAESTVDSTSAPAAAEGQPAWAEPLTTGGDLISTIEAGSISIEVYQMATTAATKTGQFADPEKNEPIIDVGDEIVFVNYVITNNGDPVDLGSSLVNVTARYDDWPYMQGMDSVVDKALFAAQGVNDDGFLDSAYADPSVYTFGSGEQYSYGENFPYQAGSPIAFSASAIPVDAAGDLLHDKKAEGEAAGTIN
ncbi:hypothetical protein GM708_16570 [Vibrio cholerae]|jgi:hypothetical protein|nr:hypothetical protein [Vibrio cholerae]